MEIQGDEAGKHNGLGSTGERQALHQLQPLARAAPAGRRAGHRRGRLGRGARGVHRRAVASELAWCALGMWSVAAVDGIGGKFSRWAVTLLRRPPHPPNPKNHHNTRISLTTRRFYGARVEKHETRLFLGTILGDKPKRLPHHTSARSSTSAGRWKCCSRRLAEVGGLLRGDVVVGREQIDINSRRQGRCRKFSFRQLLPEMARPPDVGTVGRHVQPDQRK